MKKTVSALVAGNVLAAFAGLANAQSTVQIYGLVDTGYIKETGSDARMGHNYESRIGFRGQEDLGAGLKATFELERRLNLNNGTQSTAPNVDDRIHQQFGSTRSTPDWVGAANVGLASNAWGAIRLGRANNLAVETYLRIDPFAYYSVGAATAANNLVYAEQLSNTVRFDSPAWNGFGFGLSYSLGEDEDTLAPYRAGRDYYYRDKGNDGWNVMLKYDSGPLLLLGNYQRVADSNNSYLWNLGAAYQFGPARVSLGYQDTRTKLDITGGEPVTKQRDWIVGLKWQAGPGELNASFNYGKYKGLGINAAGISSRLDDDVMKYALGYTYHLSKRTSIYGIISYIDSDNEMIGAIYNTNGTYRESMTGVQIGMQHRF